MNATINYSGFVDMFLDSDEDFEPYGCNDLNENIEMIYNHIQACKAEFNDREYVYDE